MAKPRILHKEQRANVSGASGKGAAKKGAASKKGKAVDDDQVAEGELVTDGEFSGDEALTMRYRLSLQAQQDLLGVLDPAADGLTLRKTSGKAHVPTPYTRYQVRMMSSFGIQQELIAKILDITTMTLDKHYHDDLQTGLARATGTVAARLFSTAVYGLGKEAVTAQIFWLKTRGRWKEANHVELSGIDGGPIETEEVGALTDGTRAKRLLQLLIRSQIEGTAGPAASDGDDR